MSIENVRKRLDRYNQKIAELETLPPTPERDMMREWYIDRVIELEQRFDEPVSIEYSPERTPITLENLSGIKDALLALKQGEALERDTRPLLLEEAIGLGYFGPTAVLALAHMILMEDLLNNVTGLQPTDEGYHAIRDFARHVGVASGSRGAKRLEKSLETIGMLGPQFGMPAQHVPLQPEKVNLNE